MTQITSRLRRNAKNGALVLALAAGSVFGTMPLKAQAPSASDQDKQFLTNTAQDTNFEIKTGQLALQKSKSADVKAYARMVIQDHTALKPMIRKADQAAKEQVTPATSMNGEDQTTYDKLKGLSGDDFDQAYIKELVKGNQKGVDEAKSEASNSGVPAVKGLAQKRSDLDSKHTEKAKQLAEAHNVQS